MNIAHSYTIFPLGDGALTIDFGNTIDESINNEVLQLFHKLRSFELPYVLDIVPAYSSLTIYYNICYLLQNNAKHQTAFDTMIELLEDVMQRAADLSFSPYRTIKIPVCYAASVAPDLEEVARQKKISVNEVINLHTATSYRVYMIGFLPGFPYMGKVDGKLAVPRKATPSTSITAGAVGIAGRQTGIYPIDSPGGWQIVGRTPVKIFNKQDKDPVLLQPGDRVTFYSISEDEFENYQSRHY